MLFSYGIATGVFPCLDVQCDADIVIYGCIFTQTDCMFELLLVLWLHANLVILDADTVNVPYARVHLSGPLLMLYAIFCLCDLILF